MTTPTPAARTTDPETSHKAAKAVRRSTSAHVRARVCDLLREYGPMTDEEIAARYNLLYRFNLLTSPSGLRTRRHELVVDGSVKDSGDRAISAGGRQATVWALTAGSQAVAA